MMAARRVGVLAGHTLSTSSFAAPVSHAAAPSLRPLATQAAAPRKTQRIRVNGHDIHVVTAGSLDAGVPVLCMPGAMGTAETDFSYQLDGLSQKHGVVSLDPRGYGQSRPPSRRYPRDFYHVDADDAA